jgi:RNA 2',3'-cyclic 3'-phosphodiesterase
MPDTKVRLFFALWPDPATGAAIVTLARELEPETGGRTVAAQNVHLTLAFLGQQPAEVVPTLCASAGGVKLSAFVLVLDEVGCWHKSGIEWLGASAIPEELSTFHVALVRELGNQEITFDARPFAPHLTLARRTTTTVRRRLPQPIVWNVASFCLVASELDRSGPRYRVLETWPSRR